MRDAVKYRQALRLIRGAIALGRGCVDCGARNGQLDWDHRDPDSKRFSLSKTSNRTLAVMFEEMAKCDVRCQSCHALRHERIRLLTLYGEAA